MKDVVEKKGTRVGHATKVAPKKATPVAYNKKNMHDMLQL